MGGSYYGQSPESDLKDLSFVHPVGEELLAQQVTYGSLPSISEFIK